jgi:hypothetical protein
MDVGASSYRITLCCSQDFIHAGGSLEHLAEGIHTQRQHAMLEAKLFDFKTAGSIMGQLSNLFIGDQKFVDAESTGVSESPASPAALSAK